MEKVIGTVKNKANERVCDVVEDSTGAKKAVFKSSRERKKRITAIEVPLLMKQLREYNAC